MQNPIRHQQFEQMARAMHEAGIQLVPCIPGTKQPMLKWSQYRKGILDDDGNHTDVLLRNSDEQLEEWLSSDAIDAFLMVMGEVSGNLENLDFDANAQEIYPRFQENNAVQEAFNDVTTIETGKGYHNLYYRNDADSKKRLAFTEDGSIMIEALCEGQLSMMPYSRHPSGRYYIPVGEPDPYDFVNSIPTLDADALYDVYSASMWFDTSGIWNDMEIDETTVREAFTQATKRNGDYSNGRYSAIHEYNDTHDISVVLRETGHVLKSASQNEMRFTLDGGGGEIKVDVQKNIAIVYGESHPLSDKASKNKGVITPFDLYAHFESEGNTTKALKALSGPVKRGIVGCERYNSDGSIVENPSMFTRRGETTQPVYGWVRTEEIDTTELIQAAEDYLADNEETEPTSTQNDGMKMYGSLADLLAMEVKTEWVIKNFLEQGDLAYIVAASNTGKTFVTLDILLHIAVGRDALGGKGKVKQARPVIYCTREGTKAFHRRVQAAILNMKLTETEMQLAMQNFKFFYTPFTFDVNNKAFQEWFRIVESYGLEQPVIVFDTYVTYIDGGDPSDTSAVQKANEARRYVHDQLDATSITITHLPKNSVGQTKVNRQYGSVFNGANAETQYELSVTGENNGNKALSLEVTKGRDMATGVTFDCELNIFQTGKDEDGDPETSCYIAWTDGEPSFAKDELKDTRIVANDPVSIIKAFAQKDETFTVRDIANWNSNFDESTYRNKLTGKQFDKHFNNYLDKIDGTRPQAYRIKKSALKHSDIN